MKIVIGTVCIAAGAFVAYWAFRVLRFKQALDAFGRDILEGEVDHPARQDAEDHSQRQNGR